MAPVLQGLASLGADVEGGVAGGHVAVVEPAGVAGGLVCGVVEVA